MKRICGCPRGESFRDFSVSASGVIPRASSDALQVTCNTAEMARSTPSGDLQLAWLINRALQATGHLCLRHLDIVVEGAIVILRGKLPRYYLKQRAHAAIRAIPGVGNVRDEVEIISV